MTIDRDALVEEGAKALAAFRGDIDHAGAPRAKFYTGRVRAVLDAILPDVQRDAWAEGYEARVQQVETEQRYDTVNPYRKGATE